VFWRQREQKGLFSEWEVKLLGYISIHMEMEGFVEDGQGATGDGVGR